MHGVRALLSTSSFVYRLDFNKSGNVNRTYILLLSGTKQLLYGTRVETKNSRTVPDVPGHLATMNSLTLYLHYNIASSCSTIHCNKVPQTADLTLTPQEHDEHHTPNAWN